jgi:hypothetical protein
LRDNRCTKHSRKYVPILGRHGHPPRAGALDNEGPELDLFLIKSEPALTKRASRTTMDRKAADADYRSYGYIHRGLSAPSLRLTVLQAQMTSVFGTILHYCAAARSS